VPDLRYVWPRRWTDQPELVLQVPLDYNNQTGEKAAIAMLRIKAKIPPTSKDYRGPILFNPGEFTEVALLPLLTLLLDFQVVLGARGSP
jgi:hypothetical protein